MLGSSSPAARGAAVTLTGSELERIKRVAHAQSSLLSMKTLKEEEDAAARVHRKELSATRTAQFPNTLAALRRRKQHAREERLAVEEEARCKVDAEEDELRQAERLRILEAAHRKLVDNTDKMKLLRSHRLASYVADVREDQIALAERRRAVAKGAEEEEFRALLGTIKEAEARERAEVEARAAQRRAVAVGQKLQLADFLRRRMEEGEAYKAEGRRIAEKAAADAHAEEAERERRRAAVVAANREMAEVNAQLMRLKEEGRKEAAREEERLEAYLAAKQRETETKAAIVRGKQEEAARKARIIAEKNEREFAARVHGEEERVAAAVAEATAKADALDSYRRERQRQMRADIEEHRLAQQRRTDAEAAAAAKAAAEEAARFEANIRSLEGMEARDAAERRTRERFLREYHLAQMADKKRNLGEALDAERGAAAVAGETAAGRRVVDGTVAAAFGAAAEALVGEEAGRGHRTLTLRRAIAKSGRDRLIAATAIM